MLITINTFIYLF